MMVSNISEIKFHYDSEVDVLYAHIGKPQIGKVIFDEDGIVIRVNPETNKVVGFTIINYMRRVKDGLLNSVPNFEHLTLPIYG